MDEARRMLETTDLAIDEIAERCGFSTTLSLRTHFRHRLDTTPTTYRRTFRPSHNVAQNLLRTEREPGD